MCLLQFHSMVLIVVWEVIIVITLTKIHMQSSSKMILTLIKIMMVHIPKVIMMILTYLKLQEETTQAHIMLLQSNKHTKLLIWIWTWVEVSITICLVVCKCNNKPIIHKNSKILELKWIGRTVHLITIIWLVASSNQNLKSMLNLLTSNNTKWTWTMKV